MTHSLSPLLHRAAYAALELDWTYDAIDCGETELPVVLASRSDWAGLSCTMPLKRAALDLADEIDDTARRVGAANTLLPLDAGWRAANTDGYGLVQAVREVAGHVSGQVAGGDAPIGSMTILGAGGTAQAAVVACAELGLDSCTVLVRDPARTSELRAAATRAGVHVAIGALDPAAAALTAELVVSTLPAGAADPLASRVWLPGQIVVDVVYDPWPTRLAAAAAASGAVVVDGSLMLLHQAAAQVELMTARPAPLEVMRSALQRVRAG